MKPGIHTIDIDAYHSGPGISKSKLFTLHNRTPYHARFSPPKDTNAQKFGNAAHTAVLEPNLFEVRYMRGPADRRGNKWGAAQEIAAQTGKEALTEDDYDSALRLRDVLHRDADVRKLTAGAPAIEQSAYWTDEETGELCRCRPDLYNHDLRVMVDLKATTDASAWAFGKRVEEFAYHMQEGMYSEGWEAAPGGGPVDAFMFLTVEKEEPHAFKLWELKPSAAQEGYAMYRTALGVYHECMEAEREVRKQWKGAPDSPDLDAMLQPCWPMYGAGVGQLDIPSFGYRLTKREE